MLTFYLKQDRFVNIINSYINIEKVKMKFKTPAIKIVFFFSIFAFLYFLYKDLTAADSLKGYYITQGYFFVFLGIVAIVINFLDNKIHSYFFIIFF